MKASSYAQQVQTGSPWFARAAIVGAILAGSLAGMAVTSFIQGSGPAGAEERASAGVAPSTQMAPSLLPGNGDPGHFAFGYLEFDWKPADGVAGFDSWPPGTRRQ